MKNKNNNSSVFFKRIKFETLSFLKEIVLNLRLGNFLFLIFNKKILIYNKIINYIFYLKLIVCLKYYFNYVVL